MENLSGQSIKGYELMERIGSGAFGAVYRSYQSTLGREVALKVILPGFANHPNFIRRFEMEAQLIARLEHIHIVPLYDYWRDPSGAFLAMRWLRGGSLKEAISDRPLSLQEAGRLLDQVGSALAAAHRNEIVHRDLKPSNILLDEEGNSYLADFGIALDKTVLAGATAEEEGILGSPAYLSPEQARRELVTPSSDIYNLGVTLYETLTGVHPFAGASPVECLYKHLNDPLPQIETLDPEFQEDVNAIIQKATAKNPRHRYQDIMELVAVYRRAVDVEDEGRDQSLVESLTPREQEILSLIVAGQTNKQIAQGLYIEVSTVKWYVTQMYRKMNVRSRVQAISRARALELILPGKEYPDEEARSVTTALAVDMLRNPYKGLRAFEAADSRDFFGREALTERLVKRLGEHGYLSRFLAVVGPSGSGKSSLVKAGLLPALRRGALPGSRDWFFIEMVPGVRPLEELEIALTRISADQAGNIRGHLERGESGLLRVAGLILPRDGTELFIVIDQFEQIFTLTQDEAARQQFLDLLYTAASEPGSRVRLVIALRADFYDRPLQYPDFGELLRHRMETILPLSAEALERAIFGPAERVGVRFEPGLVATIIDEINYQPGALPLLQFALTELFENRQERTLTHQAYEQIGGATGALARRAEEIFQDLSDEGRKAARQLFLRLVSPGDISGDGRKAAYTAYRALRSNLLALAPDDELMDEVIDTFAAYRLLSLDHDLTSRSPTVELAHEALFREWDRLSSWMEESQEDLRQQQRLRHLAQEWIASDREPGYVLRGAQLDVFLDWAARSDLALAPAERVFLDAGIAARQEREQIEGDRRLRELRTAQQLAETERKRAEEHAQSAQRLRRRAVYLSGTLILALLLAAAAFLFARQAEAQRRVSFARELAAASLNQIGQDPDLGILLAVEAVGQTYRVDRTVLPEAEDALHRTVQASRVLFTLSHGGAVAFSPDGAYLATGGGDGAIKIWDADRGQELRTIAGHQEPVTDLAFSPKHDELASVSLDGRLRIWEPASGEKLLDIMGEIGDLIVVDYSPDGTRLAAGGDGAANVWDAESAARVLGLTGLGDSVSGVKFSPDGDYLITNSMIVGQESGGGITQIWELATGKKIAEKLGGAQPFLSGLDVSPDGELIASPGSVTWNTGDGVAIWHTIGDRGEIEDQEFLPQQSPVSDIAFNHQGTILASSGEDGITRVWEVASGRQVLSLAGHKEWVKTIAFRPDGKRLATSSIDGVTRVWDISSEGSREWRTFDLGSFVYDVAFSPDGTRLLVSSETAGSLVTDVLSGDIVFKLGGVAKAFYRSAFSPDGGRVASVNPDDTVSVWNVKTGRELLHLAGHLGPITRVAFSPDGTYLASSDTLGQIILWDAKDGKEFTRLKGHSAWVPGLAFDPAGTRLASGSWDSRVNVRDLTSGKKLFTLTGHQAEVWDVAFSPNGALLATAAWDSTAKIWDANSGELLSSLSHAANLTGVAFTPDGKMLATGGFDAAVRLWDVQGGKEILTLTGNQAPITSVDISRDGKKLVTSSADGSVRVFALDVADLLELARQRLTRSFTDEECQKFLHTETCPREP